MRTVDIFKELIPIAAQGRCLNMESQSLPDWLMDEYRGRITLIYLDPPFCTGKLFSPRSISGDNIAYFDNLSHDKYMALMRATLGKCHELLADNGSIYLHIDYRMSAYMRLLLDEIFGIENFMNEIIWSYKSGGRSKSHFPRKHDNIFLYSKTKNPYFNIEAVGIPRGRDRRNHMKRAVDESGRVYYSIFTNKKQYKYYEDDLVYPCDVWNDIEHLHQRDSERQGYPTQKPEALLKRIMQASSKEGDIVCDLFSGSGVTASVASALGRKWLAADSSCLAVATLRRRLIDRFSGQKKNTGEGVLFEYSPKYSKPLHGIDIDIDITNIHGTIRVYVKSDGYKLSQLSAGCISNGVFYPHASAFHKPGREDNAISVTTEASYVEAIHVITETGQRAVFVV